MCAAVPSFLPSCRTWRGDLLYINIFSYTNIRATVAKAKHSTIPQTVGTRKDIIVHLRLPDSLRMVRRVVVQGQCIREKSMVLTAVIQVQPLFTSKSLSCARLRCV